jgi:hypothetical protein
VSATVSVTPTVDPEAWTVAWFTSAQLRGRPLLTEVLPRADTLDYDWSEDAVPAGIRPQDLGVRLSTMRVIEVDGNYTFSLSARGRLRLTVDGRNVIDRWRPGTWEEVALVPLSEGSHRFVLTFGAGPSLTPRLSYAMSPSPEPEEAMTPQAPPLLRRVPTLVTVPDPLPTSTPWWFFWRR